MFSCSVVMVISYSSAAAANLAIRWYISYGNVQAVLIFKSINTRRRFCICSATVLAAAFLMYAYFATSTTVCGSIFNIYISYSVFPCHIKKATINSLFKLGYSRNVP